MATTFFISTAIALAAALLVITRANAFHALLYLIVTLLALAVACYALGAPFAAALQVLVYAGAIMVLFVFVVMLLNLGRQALRREREWLAPRVWWGPAGLCAALLAELARALHSSGPAIAGLPVAPKAVGMLLFGPYLLAVELASLLLLAALVAAWHIGRQALHG